MECVIGCFDQKVDERAMASVGQEDDALSYLEAL